ncbi:MAG TPA: polysaccharide deacetylase family protein [Elusimicrobiales bacterium]|nr:polysaccharide deacetylase family protein [Elusimicrobiales bacterium]
MLNNLIIIASAATIALFSARWNWWRTKAKGLPVLMYHKIGRPPKNSKFKKLWVSPKKFERQINYLIKHKFTPINFSDLNNPEKLPKKPVLITFDDGYKDNYKVAYPILKEKNAKANIFLAYESIGKHNRWHNPDEEHWLPMLTWDEIKQMTDEGLIEFGAHTLNHKNLTEVDTETAKWEIEECKHRLEQKLNHPVCAFAYPYGAGAYDKEIRQLVLDAGFQFDFGIKQGITLLAQNRDYPFKRLLIRGDDNLLDFHLNVTRGKARF